MDKIKFVKMAAKFNPEQIPNTINNFVQDFLNEVKKEVNKHSEDRQMSPAANLYESETEYRYVVELSGLKKPDILIEIKNGALWVKGERFLKAPEGFKLVDNDIASGKFAKELKLPKDIQDDKIKAVFEDGFLTITLPRFIAGQAEKTISID